MTTSYKQAALNAMVVGNIVGELDKHIRNGLAKDETYTTFCIGLSLGAHVCGFIGKSSKMVINRKKSPIILTTKRRLILTQGIHVSTLIVIYIQIDKIVALDPAGPIFDWHPPEFRLNKNDASVVHVFHTSVPFNGLEDPIGDVDFYPNGLWNNQPQSCPNSDNIKCGCPKEFSTGGPVNYFPFIFHNQGDVFYCNHYQ